MAKKPLVRAEGPPADAVNAQVRRLLAANAQVQADVKGRSGADPDEEVTVTLLKAIIDQLPERVFAKDLQGRFLVANDAVARDRGLEQSEDIVGKTDFDLFPVDVAQGYFELEQALLSTGEPMIDVEEERLDENGAHKWLLTSKAPMRNDRGEIVGLIGVGRDITERKRIDEDQRAERALFRSMIDRVPDYLFVKDRQSRFVVANRAVAEDLGRKPEDLIGRTDFDLHRGELAAKFFADEQRIIASGNP